MLDKDYCRITPNNGSESSIFPQKVKVLEIHIVKINNPTYGNMPTVMEASGRFGRRIRLTDQP